MNPHAEKAQDSISASKKAYASEHASLHAIRAQAEASLAIAFELQTANILALETRLLEKPSVNEHMLAESAERLGYDLNLNALY